MTLKERREALGLTQTDVAEKLVVDQSAICHWETGKHSPVRKYRKALAKLYNCTEDELFGNAKEPREAS